MSKLSERAQLARRLVEDGAETPKSFPNFEDLDLVDVAINYAIWGIQHSPGHPVVDIVSTAILQGIQVGYQIRFMEEEDAKQKAVGTDSSERL